MESKVWKDRFFGVGIAIMVLGSFAYGILVLYLGYVGIAESFGQWWALGALFLAIFLRFIAPIVIGAMFGAIYLWDWHWATALVLVMPGVILVIPALMLGMFEWFRTKF